MQPAIERLVDQHRYQRGHRTILGGGELAKRCEQVWR
jgi:hypothetical protein